MTALRYRRTVQGVGDFLRVGPRYYQPAGIWRAALDALGQPLSAAELTERLQRSGWPQLTVEQVEEGLQRTLLPKGLVQAEGLPSGAVPSLDSPLRWRRRLLSGRRVAWLARPLQPLLGPPALAMGSLAMLVLLIAGLDLGAMRLAAASLQWMGLLTAFLVLLVCLALHELGHAAAMGRQGLAGPEIGIGLYGPLPALYCDVSASSPLPPLARLQVSAGGLIVQAWAMLVLSMVWQLTASAWVAQAFLFNGFVLALNLVPFLRLDGYWLVADALNEPRLRARAARWRRERWLSLTGRASMETAVPVSVRVFAVGQICFMASCAALLVVWLVRAWCDVFHVSQPASSFPWIQWVMAVAWALLLTSLPVAFFWRRRQRR
jgi:Zn-dependent protease